GLGLRGIDFSLWSGQRARIDPDQRRTGGEWSGHSVAARAGGGRCGAARASDVFRRRGVRARGCACGSPASPRDAPRAPSRPEAACGRRCRRRRRCRCGAVRHGMAWR
ncbi:hypothetical protein, partial [Burkholderia pseudomallei]|uniref:hypothetical protein n=1 Tax=Burkholderia pseudomallei TaxID=28450 RepID=UPI001F4227EC